MRGRGEGSDAAGGARRSGEGKAYWVEGTREPDVELDDDLSSVRERLQARAHGFGNGSGGGGRHAYVGPLASDCRRILLSSSSKGLT